MEEFKIMAFDVETTGQYLGINAMIELSGVVMNQDAEVLDKFKTSLYSDGTFEKKCKEEFWDKHPDVLKKILENSVNTKIGVLDFSQWVNSMDIKHNKPTRISDFACFDASWVDLYLAKYTKRPCLYYALDQLT